MRRFASIFLFATLVAFAFAYSSLLPQRAMAASTSLSTQKFVMVTNIASKPLSNKRGGYGYREGYHDGYRDGYEAGLTACYDFYRHRDGWTDEGDWGYRHGYHDGFREGFDAGKRDCYDRGYDNAGHDFHHGDRHHRDNHDDHGNNDNAGHDFHHGDRHHRDNHDNHDDHKHSNDSKH